MPRSTIHVEPSELVNVVSMLRLLRIDVVGTVVLTVEGDIVPEAEQVTVRVDNVSGSIYAQITACCEVVE